MLSVSRLSRIFSKYTLKKAFIPETSILLIRNKSDSKNNAPLQQQLSSLNKPVNNKGENTTSSTIPTKIVGKSANNLEHITEVFKQCRYKTKKVSNDELKMLVYQLDQSI